MRATCPSNRRVSRSKELQPPSDMRMDTSLVSLTLRGPSSLAITVERGTQRRLIDTRYIQARIPMIMQYRTFKEIYTLTSRVEFKVIQQNGRLTIFPSFSLPFEVKHLITCEIARPSVDARCGQWSKATVIVSCMKVGTCACAIYIHTYIHTYTSIHKSVIRSFQAQINVNEERGPPVISLSAHFAWLFEAVR